MLKRYLKFRVFQGTRKSPRLAKLVELLYGKTKTSFVKPLELEECFSDNGLDYTGEGEIASANGIR